MKSDIGVQYTLADIGMCVNTYRRKPMLYALTFTGSSSTKHRQSVTRVVSSRSIRSDATKIAKYTGRHPCMLSLPERVWLVR